MIEATLEKLGLTKNEAVVYASLSELGKARAGKIIEATGLHRNLVYTSLETLERRKLVSKIVSKNVFVFSTNSLGVLLDELDDKKEAIKKATAELKKRAAEESNEVAVYEGEEGARHLYKKMANAPKDETLYVIGGSEQSLASELENSSRRYHKKRESRGINFKILLDRTVSSGMFGRQNQLPHTVAKYLPFDVSAPVQIAFGMGTLDITVTGKTLTTFSIKNKEAVESFKKYFDYFWNQETYILRGAEALRDIWIEGDEHGGVDFIGARGYFIDQYPALFKQIEERMHELPNSKWRIVVDPSMRGHRLTKYPWSESKFTLSNTKNLNVVWLYHNKVAINNWEEDEPVILVSENKHLVQSYRDYFDELWNKKQ